MQNPFIIKLTMGFDIGVSNITVPTLPPYAVIEAQPVNGGLWQGIIAQWVQAITYGSDIPPPQISINSFLSQPRTHPTDSSLMLAGLAPTATTTAAANVMMQAKSGQSAIPPRVIKAIERELIDYCVDLENESYVVDRPHVNGWLGPGDLVAGHLASWGHNATDPVRIRVTRHPTHGRVSVNRNRHPFRLRDGKKVLGTIELRSYLYEPDKNYLGKDYVGFEVQLAGEMFLISYELHVVKEYLAEGGAGQCPSGIDRFPQDSRRTMIVSAETAVAPHTGKSGSSANRIND